MKTNTILTRIWHAILVNITVEMCQRIIIVIIIIRIIIVIVISDYYIIITIIRIITVEMCQCIRITMTSHIFFLSACPVVGRLSAAKHRDTCGRVPQLL